MVLGAVHRTAGSGRQRRYRLGVFLRVGGRQDGRWTWMDILSTVSPCARCLSSCSGAWRLRLGGGRCWGWGLPCGLALGAGHSTRPLCM
jgi:hypothetical protein